MQLSAPLVEGSATVRAAMSCFRGNVIFYSIPIISCAHLIFDLPIRYFFRPIVFNADY